MSPSNRYSPVARLPKMILESTLVVASVATVEYTPSKPKVASVVVPIALTT